MHKRPAPPKKMAKFGAYGTNIPVSARKAATAKREGIRLYEDEALGSDRRKPGPGAHISMTDRQHQQYRKPTPGMKVLSAMSRRAPTPAKPPRQTAPQRSTGTMKLKPATKNYVKEQGRGQRAPAQSGRSRAGSWPVRMEAPDRHGTRKRS